MIITEDKSDAQYQIKAYTTGQITVNTTSYSRSLIISANTLYTDWAPQSFNELKLEHWQHLIDLVPEIILLGTGPSFYMPQPSLLAPIYTAHLSIEVMTTDAACRTYMALISENRHVVAALLIH